MDVEREVIAILERVLGPNTSVIAMGQHTALLGNIPELDSMAVATLITSLEDHFGFAIADDEIDGSNFATVGTLVEFVRSKLAS